MYDSVSSLDKSIQPYVYKLLSYNQFGIFKQEVQLHRNCNYNSNQFSLLIPYANKKLKWDVYFDLEHLQLGPDFTFDDDSFFTDPSAQELANNLPSLARWNARDPSALLNVIKELLNYYKLCQLKVCEELTDRLKLEYDMLTSSLKGPEDVEVIVSADKGRYEVSFYIFLNLNFSSLPYRSSRICKDLAILVITYQVPDCSVATPRLDITENLKETLQKIGSIDIPLIDSNLLWMDYVAEVRSLLEEKIKVISNSFRQKFEFISLLRVHQTASILEYDSEEFRFVTLLLKWESTYFIVKFVLSDVFPLEPPNVTLYSVYYQSGMKAGHVVKNFEYDDSWPTEQIVSTLFRHILEKELDKFTILSEQKKP